MNQSTQPIYVILIFLFVDPQHLGKNPADLGLEGKDWDSIPKEYKVNEEQARYKWSIELMQSLIKYTPPTNSGRNSNSQSDSDNNSNNNNNNNSNSSDNDGNEGGPTRLIQIVDRLIDHAVSNCPKYYS